MNERSAILLAGTAHLALLAALSLSWAMTAKTLPTFEEMTPVEVVDIADVPKVVEEPKPSMEAAPQETIEEAAPEPEPEPEPTPPVPQTISEVPPPDVKPVERPKPPKAETPPKPKAKPLDAQQLANLLDKNLPKAAKRPLDTSKFADTIEKSLPKGAKIDARAAATLQQAIQSQVAPCWNPPIGGDDTDKMTVVLRIELARDGKLIGVPGVIAQTGKTAGNAAYARAFAESARRAVARCAPLKLPADLYDAWRLFELNFDPTQMT